MRFPDRAAGVYGRFCAFSTVRFLSYVQTLDVGVACLFGSTIIIPTFIKHLVTERARACSCRASMDTKAFGRIALLFSQ